MDTHSNKGNRFLSSHPGPRGHVLLVSIERPILPPLSLLVLLFTSLLLFSSGRGRGDTCCLLEYSNFLKICGQ